MFGYMLLLFSDPLEKDSAEMVLSLEKTQNSLEGLYNLLEVPQEELESHSGGGSLGINK